MSPQQENEYLALMMDVYRRLRDSENNRRFLRDICGKGTPEAQNIACVQLFLVTRVHAFAPNEHQALAECGGRYFEQAVDNQALNDAVMAVSDAYREVVASKIAPRVVYLEKTPFGLFEEL